MPLFDFTLRPLSRIKPWGEPDNPSLSWFGLTDGGYSVNVDGARLFQYTGEFLRSRDPLNDRFGDCADYQVVRLYEDILEMLPDILVEVPEAVHNLICDVQAHREWSRSLAWITECEDDSQLDLYVEAVDWIRLRRLDSLYLIDGPNIWIWRHKNRIHIQWDNAGMVTDGIPRWTAISGDYSVPVDLFLREVESFHLRLMSAMSERVSVIEQSNPFAPGVIDVAGLVREHKERELSLVRALSAVPDKIDWELVIQANAKLRSASDLRGSKTKLNDMESTPPRRRSMTSPKLLDSIINSRPAGFLKEHGFRKKGRAFYREVDGVFQYVHFVTSHFGTTAGMASFTLQVGVTFRHRHPKPPEKMLGTLIPVIGRRFGPDADHPVGQFWVSIAVEPTAAEVIERLSNHVIPFFEKHSFEEVTRIWDAGGRMIQRPTIQIRKPSKPN